MTLIVHSVQRLVALAYTVPPLTATRLERNNLSIFIEFNHRMMQYLNERRFEDSSELLM